MADDPSQSVADSQVLDPNIIPPPESASSPADRPISTVLADSPAEPKTPLADPATDYTIPPTVPDESTVATESPSVVTSPPAVLDDSASQPSADSQTTVPTESSVATQSATVSTEAQGEASPPPPPPDPTEGGSIQDSSPSNQPSQVQQEAPVNASSLEASQTQEIPPQSAEIKPEPLEGTQNAPLADPDSQKFSFGDILEGTGELPAPVTPVPVPIQPPSPPVLEPVSSTPITSFGDLGAKPPIEEPTINIEAIEPSKPEPSQLPTSPQSPLSPQPPTETIVEAKADFSTKRQQALQTRRKKREDHLAKIIALVSQKGKVFNRDVRDVLRVSQSTATNYLHSLVKDGKIKKEGKVKATIYSL